MDPVRRQRVALVNPGRPRTGTTGAIRYRDRLLIYFREELGWTYGELSQRFRISRQRVGAIVKAHRPEVRPG